MDYIRSIDREPGGCFLCEAWAGQTDPADRLEVHRDERGLILLNRYPYVNGHLLVAVGDHLADLPALSAGQRRGLMELTTLAERIVQTTFDPHGVNIGMNIGRAAGAGVPGHLHVHVLPRWNGDTNFMSVVGQVRVIPQALEACFEEMRKVADLLSEDSPRHRADQAADPDESN